MIRLPDSQKPDSPEPGSQKPGFPSVRGGLEPSPAPHRPPQKIGNIQENAPTVEVAFEESEFVRPFGTCTIRYRILMDRVWVSPSQLPGARTVLGNKSPSVLWRRQIVVELQVGTEVEKIVVTPERGSASAADILMGKATGYRQRTQRTDLRVAAKGTLVPR